MVDLNKLRGITYEKPQSDKRLLSMDKYGQIIRREASKRETKTYTVGLNEQPALVFDEDSQKWMVNCGDKNYPLFDEKYGLAEFRDENGKPLVYDSRIPIKEGEEPYKEIVDEKAVIRFGPNHQYCMPYESENGCIYDQMKYEKGGTVMVAMDRERWENRNNMNTVKPKEPTKPNFLTKLPSHGGRN